MSPARLPVASRTCAALVGLLALSALTLQYILLVQLTRDTIGVALGTLRFVTYFTILSNIAVALVAFTAATGRPRPFSRTTTERTTCTSVASGAASCRSTATTGIGARRDVVRVAILRCHRKLLVSVVAHACRDCHPTCAVRRTV